MSNTASPNAAGFMRFQESPVNYYNGKSSFSIPIYEINVGGIKYPISLYYAQGGIQVNTVSSDVGLGWSLTSSFINRTVVGDADWETIRDTKTGSEKTKYGYYEYLRAGSAAFNETKSIDFYPDLFKFVSPTNSTRFYYPNEWQFIELDKKKTDITYQLESKKHKYLLDSKEINDVWINDTFEIIDYKSFEVITKDGISYSFQPKDITHSFINSAENGNNTYFGNITGTYPRVSSWYVSKIKNLNGLEEVDFTYESYTTETTNKVDNIINSHPYYRYESKFPASYASNIASNIYFRSDNQASLYDGDYGRYYNRLLEVQRLKKIKFRGGSVEFNYDLNRDDLTNGKALTGIIIKDENNNIVKEFELKYDYFESTLIKNEFSKRLKLLSVQEKGHNKYEFEYFEDHKLPNVGSPLQDFFGYNNTDETTVETPTYILSKYYYYPNKNEYSILPYNITNDSNHYLLINERFLNEQIDKEPNDLSKTWSLKSVTLPTGGKNTYVLESNTFNLWGNTLKGGGSRIKQQIIKEQTGGQQRTINYYYNKNATTTSGYLFNVPQAGYPTSMLFPVSTTSPNLSSYGLSLVEYFFIYNNAKLNYDLLNNFFIGYSKVEENEDGIKTVYEFTNEEKPNILTRSYTKYDNTLSPLNMHPLSQFLISNSGYGNNFYIDNSHRRGKPKYISFYDKNGDLKAKKENIYNGYLDQSGNDMDYGQSIVGAAIYVDPLSSNYDSYELMQFQKTYYTTNYNLTYSKTTKYLPSGNIEDESYRYYDGVNQNLVGSAHKIGNGVTYPNLDVKKYIYPYNIPNYPFQTFEEINKFDTPVLTQSYSGEIDPANIGYIAPWKMTSQSKIIFSNDNKTSNMIMPTQAMTAIGQDAFYEVGKFDLYDDKGNLLQSTKDGLSTTYIYGYKQLYPIAKIVGATYDQVMSAMGEVPTTNTSYLNLNIVKKSDLDKDQTTENDLITALDSFRKEANLAGYAVTTFTYNPLVGVTSVTPPSGMREVYVYEAVTNKLKEVKRMEKDASGNDVYRTLKEYEYHYKP
ncbi:MAG: hypothetical protein BGO86_01845 [Chryseobacterium sp. 36-9]|nr:MAG: hypothetical protein BGO86_01845 [Chryseobacterium sp. 36-9]